MRSLFDPPDRQSVLVRLGQLQSGAPRQWGKMNAAQMLAHCSVAMEMATGETPRKQKLIGNVNTFCDSGPERASAHTHSFLGRLRGEQWGVMMYKHLDHHLRQFGV